MRFCTPTAVNALPCAGTDAGKQHGRRAVQTRLAGGQTEGRGPTAAGGGRAAALLAGRGGRCGAAALPGAPLPRVGAEAELGAPHRRGKQRALQKAVEAIVQGGPLAAMRRGRLGQEAAQRWFAACAGRAASGGRAAFMPDVPSVRTLVPYHYCCSSACGRSRARRRPVLTHPVNTRCILTLPKF